MLNRRFLRMKAFQSLYSFSVEENADAQRYKKRMLEGIEKTYELYLFMLSFPVELKNYIQSELGIEEAKFIPSKEIIISLQNLSNNKVINCIEENAAFRNALIKVPCKWSNANDFLKKILGEILKNQAIIDYSSKVDHSFQEDKSVLTTILELVSSDSDLFESYIEDLFSNWEDDQVLILTTLQKTLHSIKNASSNFLVPMHIDEEEDIKFLNAIFDYTLQNQEELTELISLKTQNWDQDRIAMVDMVLMTMALSEILYFPFIPVKVTINEYLELAKLYSTPSSHGFINGILDKIQIDLRKENRIQKMGRGLVD